MYTIVEIDKTSQYFGAFTPYAPYVFSTIVKYDTAGTYWVDDFGSGEDSQSNDLNVTSVTLQSIHDVEKMDTLSDCLDAENSFWFDFDNQVLYVHFPHVWAPEIVDILIGQAWGYCSDTVRYLRNQLYRPLVKSIPQLRDETDPLQYGIISFRGGSIVLSNDGEFDSDRKLYGNNVRIKRGKEGDSYDDLILMYSGYVKDYTITTSELELVVADKRERLQLEYPDLTIEVLDKYVGGVDWETKQVLLPDGYGQVNQVPAYPIAVNCTWEGIDCVKFRWGIETTSIDSVIVDSDQLIPIAYGNANNDGTFVCAYADVAVDGLNPESGIKKVLVTGTMRNIKNPGDIIVDLNERIYGVVYNNTNYDITEFEAEAALFADVSLYMGQARRVYEWIEELQNGANYGFRYEDAARRTIRLDLPTRPVVLDIKPLDIRNSDIPIHLNAELYASSCLVKYAKRWREDNWQSVLNTNYESAVINEFKIKKVREYESLLVNKVDAEEKAEIVMSDIHVVRPIVTLRLDSSLYPAPRVFDMITATVSLIEGNEPQPIDWPYVLGGVYVLGDELVLGSKSSASLTPSGERCRVYLGAITGQVIGIEWLTETDEIEIKVRVK